MIVELKQCADQSAVASGLHKHNRSKFPNTFEIVQPAKNTDGRWLTGMDENALFVNAIPDSVRRAERKEELNTLREELSRLTGFDLSATNNEYWSSYKVVLRETVSLDLANPDDKVKYLVLLANGYVVPELGMTNNPDYVNTKYYVSRKEEESKGRMLTKKQKDEAKSKLLEVSRDYDKLILIAKFVLGAKRIKTGMDADIIYEEISNFIDDPKDTSNVDLFLDATSRTIESLQYKLTIDEAIRSGQIKFRDGYYQRGNATYGKTLKEVIAFLSSVENSTEFASLKEDVEGDIS
jgi:hypothetical protein